jgi:hypothetical protein
VRNASPLFRWRDRTGGKAIYRRIVVGTIEQSKTQADAREIVEGAVFEINSDHPRFRTGELTMSQLLAHSFGFMILSNGCPFTFSSGK